MVRTSASKISGERPRWRSFFPSSRSSVRQKTAMMKVLRSMKETPSVFSAAWNTTEHSGGSSFSTPQRNLHAGLASLSTLQVHLKLTSTNCLLTMVNFFMGCKLDRMEIDAIRLRQLREERALSLRELEQLAGVSYNTIWRIEDGRRKQAHPRTIRKLAAALGVQPQELVVRD